MKKVEGQYTDITESTYDYLRFEYGYSLERFEVVNHGDSATLSLRCDDVCVSTPEFDKTQLISMLEQTIRFLKTPSQENEDIEFENIDN